MVVRRYARPFSPSSLPPSALYLQFSFVNNKPWRRRGSDFNEGINNPIEGYGLRVGNGGSEQRGERTENRKAGKFKQAYREKSSMYYNDHNRVAISFMPMDWPRTEEAADKSSQS